MPQLFYCTSLISEHIGLTPEGYLVCYGVPISVAGEFVYTAEELPGFESIDGKIVVTRPIEELLSPSTIASVEGKPITIGHPRNADGTEVELVGPDTWRDYAKGQMQNSRAGANERAGMLLADLFITDPTGIDLIINKQMREVSLGFTVKHVQTEPGRAVQTCILVNHVAITSRGRCGPECAVADSAEERTEMNPTLKEKVLAIFGKAFDEAAKGEDKKDGGEGAANNADLKAMVAAFSEEMKKMAEKMAILDEISKTIESLKASKAPAPDPAGDEEAKKKAEAEAEAAAKAAAGDSKCGDSLDDMTIARAEILAPSVPRDKDIKKNALLAAQQAADTKEAVTTVLMGRAFDSLTPPELDLAFVAAAEIVRANRRAENVKTIPMGDSAPDGQMTPAKLNAYYQNLRKERK